MFKHSINFEREDTRYGGHDMPRVLMSMGMAILILISVGMPTVVSAKNYIRIGGSAVEDDTWILAISPDNSTNQLPSDPDQVYVVTYHHKANGQSCHDKTLHFSTTLGTFQNGLQNYTAKTGSDCTVSVTISYDQPGQATITVRTEPPVLIATATQEWVISDADGDGIADSVDNCPMVPNPDQLDTDGDGIGDACDADDDGDGVVDVADNCPLIPNAAQLDTDGDGAGDTCELDDDNDGVLEPGDNCPQVGNPDQVDTDGDGLGNICDPDDDNDGIGDSADNCLLVSNPDQTDIDEDGIGDACDGDSAGGAIDTDGDGLIDSEDNCPYLANPDQTDTDGDGIGDVCDADDDNDSIPDIMDNCPLIGNIKLVKNPSFETNPTIDWRSYTSQSTLPAYVWDSTVAYTGTQSIRIDSTDTVSQFYALQSFWPSAGISAPSTIKISGWSKASNVSGGTDKTYSVYVDVYYADGTTLYAQTAPFSPGTHDWEHTELMFSITKPINHINLGCVFYYRNGTVWFDDLSMEIVTGTDGCPVNDSDGDGWADTHDNCVLIPNIDQADIDTDGIGDVCESDTDGDGIIDGMDNCPFIANPDQINGDGDSVGDACDTDNDNDGIQDSVDNCVLIPNANQLDTDGDKIGDACDADDDNDGIQDSVDNCPLVSNPDQADANADWIGDACDIDRDGDGIIDGMDNCPFIANPDQVDSDRDSIGDACDTDNDGDGIIDSSDNCPFIANPDQVDTDADGIGDACDQVEPVAPSTVIHHHSSSSYTQPLGPVSTKDVTAGCGNGEIMVEGKGCIRCEPDETYVEGKGCVKNETAIVTPDVSMTSPTSSGMPGFLSYLPYFLLIAIGLLALFVARKWKQRKERGIPSATSR